jgi:hypothetical protein
LQLGRDTQQIKNDEYYCNTYGTYIINIALPMRSQNNVKIK